jgi:predicted O-methyltransferase YrrM
MQLQIMFYNFEAMSFKFFIAYFKHQLTANNRHGTHSPFVYRLADEVIYDFSDKKVYTELYGYRKKLLNDVNDASKANSVNNTLQAKDVQNIKVLAKKLLKKPSVAKLIFRLALNSAAKEVLVFDANFGLNTAYLAKALPQANVVAVENNSEIGAFANRTFEDLGLTNVQSLTGNYTELLPANRHLDFVYVDGNQSKKTVLAYFNWCLPQLYDQSIFICNDIHNSKEIQEAWAELKNHPKVTVTIDLFWLGVVFFRKGQVKEHFKLKF